MLFTVRILFCIVFASCITYLYLDGKNEIMSLRLSIPIITREIHEIQSLNTRLHYEVECFENPQNLIELSQKAEFGHLTYPCVDDIVLLVKGNPIPEQSDL